jgi:hypothetical protein
MTDRRPGDGGILRYQRERDSGCNVLAQPGGSHMIEIALGAATVRVPPGIDAVSLTTVLRVVKVAT